ncbi:carboxylesterase family protein [Streptomyces erythrogriseus]
MGGSGRSAPPRRSPARAARIVALRLEVDSLPSSEHGGLLGRLAQPHTVVGVGAGRRLPRRARPHHPLVAPGPRPAQGRGVAFRGGVGDHHCRTRLPPGREPRRRRCRSPAVPDRSHTGGAGQGVLNDERDVEIFAGIPYARPPVGDLRWRPPQPPEPRSALLTADRFSDVPVQGTSTFLTRALSQVVEAPLEGTLLNPYPVSEDSLYLNIWRGTSPSTERLPVIVYIPGGGFATGSGALPLYDGESLASRGQAITVTINYRLGVLGFLSHPDLAAESGAGASGNYGLLDQIAALWWVRQNIAAFGGDPERVTIAGESAGGESVCILGATPAPRDWCTVSSAAAEPAWARSATPIEAISTTLGRRRKQRGGT